jgi:hypothetical protein
MNKRRMLRLVAAKTAAALWLAAGLALGVGTAHADFTGPGWRLASETYLMAARDGNSDADARRRSGQQEQEAGDYRERRDERPDRHEGFGRGYEWREKQKDKRERGR